MTSEKLKPTAGPWTPRRLANYADPGWVILWPDKGGSHLRRLDSSGNFIEEDARLIAEAGSVFHECGLSPRELLERCSAMEAALNACKDALEWVVEQGGGPACEHEGGVVCFCKENNAINAARAALAKHKEV